MDSAPESRARPCGITLAELYERQRDRVFAVCFALLRSREDAEDAVQETFLRVADHVDELNGNAGGYLVTTARNVCIDEMRRRARQGRHHPGLPANLEGTASVSPEDAVVARRALADVWRYLPEADRPLFAYAFAGLSLGEIAARAEMTAGLVALRMFRARQRLRRLTPTRAAIACTVRPRALVDALSRRLRAARDDTSTAWLAQLPKGAAAIAPIVASIVVGSLAHRATPGTAPGTAVSPPAVAHLGHRAPLAVSSLTRHTPGLGGPAATVGSLAANGPGDLTSYWPSPHYNTDHVLFAHAQSDGDCGTQNRRCDGLYQTTDGGRTWWQLSTLEAPLLIPPYFPRAQTLYALDPSSGLERSDDGGLSFQVVTAVIDTLKGPDGVAESTASQAVGVLPTALPGMSTAHGLLTDTASTALRGDVAAIDPSSQPQDTRVYLLNRTLGMLSLYDSASGSVTPSVRVTPDQTSILDVVTGPGAKGVYVVAETASQKLSVYSCVWGSACQRLAAAPAELQQRSERVSSPTFGIDQTFWYMVDDGVDQVTLDGSDRHIPLPPGWYPLAVLPDAQYATTHRVQVIAASQGCPECHAILASVGGAPFDEGAARVLSPDVDAFDLYRLPDGNVLGRLRPGSDTVSFACSRDDAATWRPSC